VVPAAAVTGYGLGFGRDEEWGGDGNHVCTVHTGVDTDLILVSVSKFALLEAGEPKGAVIVSFFFYYFFYRR
jgi:hypothetical protein